MGAAALVSWRHSRAARGTPALQGSAGGRTALLCLRLLFLSWGRNRPHMRHDVMFIIGNGKSLFFTLHAFNGRSRHFPQPEGKDIHNAMPDGAPRRGFITDFIFINIHPTPVFFVRFNRMSQLQFHFAPSCASANCPKLRLLFPTHGHAYRAACHEKTGNKHNTHCRFHIPSPP